MQWYTEDVAARDLCGAGSKFNCMQRGKFVPSGALLKVRYPSLLSLGNSLGTSLGIGPGVRLGGSL